MTREDLALKSIDFIRQQCTDPKSLTEAALMLETAERIKDFIKARINHNIRIKIIGDTNGFDILLSSDNSNAINFGIYVYPDFTRVCAYQISNLNIKIPERI